MLNEFGKKRLTEILLTTFGKATFSEDELTEKFWSDLYISSNDFFQSREGAVDLDYFWSDDVRRWILEDKTDWLAGHRIVIE